MLLVQAVNFICSVLVLFIFNWIASKSLIVYADDTGDSVVEYLSEDSDISIDDDPDDATVQKETVV